MRLCYFCLVVLLLNIKYISCGFLSSWSYDFKPSHDYTINRGTARPDLWGRRFHLISFKSNKDNGDAAYRKKEMTVNTGEMLSNMVTWSMDVVNGFLNATTTAAAATSANHELSNDYDNLQRILNEGEHAAETSLQAIAALKSKQQQHVEHDEVSSDIDKSVLCNDDDYCNLQSMLDKAEEAEKEAIAALKAFEENAFSYARVPLIEKKNLQQLLEDKRLLEHEVSEMDKVRNEFIKNGEHLKLIEDVALLELSLAEIWAVSEKRLEEEPIQKTYGEKNRLVSGLAAAWDALEQRFEEEPVDIAAEGNRLETAKESRDVMGKLLGGDPGENVDAVEENPLSSGLGESSDALEKGLKERQVVATEENRMEAVQEALVVLEKHLEEELAGQADTVEETRLVLGLSEAWDVLEKRLEEERSATAEENRVVTVLEAWDVLKKRLEEEMAESSDTFDNVPLVSGFAEALGALENLLEEERLTAARGSSLDAVLESWDVLKRSEEQFTENVITDVVQESSLESDVVNAWAALEKRFEEERVANSERAAKRKPRFEQEQAATEKLFEVVRAASVKAAEEKQLENDRVAAEQDAAEKLSVQEQFAMWNITLEEDRVAAEKRRGERLEEDQVAAEKTWLEEERAAAERAEEEQVAKADTVEENLLASGLVVSWDALEIYLEDNQAAADDDDGFHLEAISEAWEDEEPAGKLGAVEENTLVLSLAEDGDAIDVRLKEQQPAAADDATAEENPVDSPLEAWDELEKLLEEEPVGKYDPVEQNRLALSLSKPWDALDEPMEEERLTSESEERAAAEKLRLEEERAADEQAAIEKLLEEVRAASLKAAKEKRMEKERVATEEADAEERLVQEQLALSKITSEKNQVAAERFKQKRLEAEQVAAAQAVDIYVRWHDV